MNDIEKMFDNTVDYFRNLFVDTATEVVDSVETKFDQAVGYASGQIDAAKQGLVNFVTEKDPNARYVYRPEQSPLFPIVQSMFGTNIPSQRAALASAGERRKMLFSFLEAVNSSQDDTPILYTKDFPNVFKDLPEGSMVTNKFARGYVEKELERLKGNTLADREKQVNDTLTPILQGIAQLSPTLVTVAAFKPRYARGLMGLHVLGDAALGLFNFRTPRPEFNFVDTVTPYLTMGTLALASQLTR
jgi:hypothetical protein